MVNTWVNIKYFYINFKMSKKIIDSLKEKITIMYCEIYNKPRRKMFDNTGTKDQRGANGNTLLLCYYMLREVI